MGGGGRRQGRPRPPSARDTRKGLDTDVKAEERGVGIVLLCDRQGIVQEVLYDGLGFAHRVTVGQLWVQIVDEASVQKAHNFLAELQTQQAAFDWELNVPLAGQVSSLRFTGAAQGEHLLIVAARTNHGAAQLFEEFMRFGNEQANALRAALKEKAELSRARVERDSALFDEISRLNNELVTLQRELAKRTAELERLNELKNRFLGMAAHDLRSPLGGIIAYSEFLLDEASDVLSQEHAEFLSIIRSYSEFMLQLVEDFLDVSIIESGKLRLDLGPVDLGALVEHNVALNRTLAEKKQIRLEFHHTEPLPEMMLDAAKMDQVVNNLISNAVKYSFPGSVVEIGVAKSETCALISVQDQGQGIPADERDRLFRMFERTTVRSTAGEKSSGLGLAIAQRIVEGHHGQISIESQVGQGTTFYVSLPLPPSWEKAWETYGE